MDLNIWQTLEVKRLFLSKIQYFGKFLPIN